MVTVAGRPFLEFVIESFSTCGFTEFVLLVGHHSDVIESHFGRGRGELRFEYSREKDLLGTGGAIRDAEHLLGERFIITYGDVLRRFDYDRFVEEHQGSCLAVYPYTADSTSISAGNVAVDAQSGLVTTFMKGAPELKLPYVDAGFAVIEKSALDLLPREGVCSFESVVYPQLAAHQELEFELVDREFYDIGNPADLARTRTELESPE
jgi:NDP-sugar pyrophosphorylase family protein